MEEILAITKDGMTFFIGIDDNPFTGLAPHRYLLLETKRGSEISSETLLAIGDGKPIRLGQKNGIEEFRNKDVQVFEFDFI